MNAGRGYVIRFYRENDNTAHYVVGSNGFSKTPSMAPHIASARVFKNINIAEGYIVELSKKIKKKWGKGYLYISKVFYKEVAMPSWNTTGKKKLVAEKLTKPDRHDFLNMI